MPASRIVFAIGDLVSAIKQIVDFNDTNNGQPPSIELRLDEPTFMAVVGEVENHYGEQLPRAVVGDECSAMFGGIDIVTRLGKPSA